MTTIYSSQMVPHHFLDQEGILVYQYDDRIAVYVLDEKEPPRSHWEIMPQYLWPVFFATPIPKKKFGYFLLPQLIVRQQQCDDDPEWLKRYAGMVIRYKMTLAILETAVRKLMPIKPIAIQARKEFANVNEVVNNNARR